MSGTVYIVHAIDTEGPLYEPLSATFERIKEIFNVELEPTYENLNKLRSGKLIDTEWAAVLESSISPHRISTLGSWDQIGEMLKEATSKEFRNLLQDSFGGGWVYSWFCLDHIDYVINPRKRDIGYHNIHDYYKELIDDQEYSQDSLEWHFHPPSIYKEAHRCATHYFRTDLIFQILSRRIIDRNFFPSCFRAGFQAERPDSHWFLEQFIPFDISNMATEDTTDLDNSIDFKNGRSGNWRKAPNDWSVYHPSHDDYQIPGNCRRLIGRALNIFNRIGNVNYDEVIKAFQNASLGEDVLLGLCSHDWRDLRPELKYIFKLLSDASKEFPEVQFKYSNAREGFIPFIDEVYKDDEPLKLEISLIDKSNIDVPYIQVDTLQGRVFGPQPYLAIKTKSRNYIYDNLDFDMENGRWFYAFHADTLPLEDVEIVAVAANDFHGRVSIARLEFT